MKLTPARTPALIKRMFPNLIWNYPEDHKAAYLTFDDGPTPDITEWTRELLNRYNAKATFFCVGSQVKAHPEIYKAILDNGHAIGNHTHNHLRGWTTRDSDYLLDVETASAFIDSQLFRPPYGQIKTSQIEKLKSNNYKVVMWSVLTKDWDQKTTGEQCVLNVTEHVAPGDIIVFHDSIKASTNLKYALPRVLAYLSENKYEFKRIPESEQ